MKTIAFVWHYDWKLNVLHRLPLAVAAGSWLLVGIAAGPRLPVRGESSWAVVWFAVMAGLLASIPFLFVANAAEVGRIASPRTSRDFLPTLPLDRSNVALGKLLSALAWVGVVPVLAVAVGCAAVNLYFGLPLRLVPTLIGEFVTCLLPFSLVFAVWTALGAALLPQRWVLLVASLFLGGEALARNVTDGESLRASFTRPLGACGVDIGLQGVCLVLLGSILVFFHVRRRRGWAVLAALVALAAIDGLRALVW